MKIFLRILFGIGLVLFAIGLSLNYKTYNLKDWIILIFTCIFPFIMKYYWKLEEKKKATKNRTKDSEISDSKIDNQN